MVVSPVSISATVKSSSVVVQFRLPQAWIKLHETRSTYLKKRRVVESRCFVPIRRGCAPFIALLQHFHRAERRIQPGDGNIYSVPDWKCDAAQLGEIRSRRESEIQIDALLQAGHD